MKAFWWFLVIVVVGLIVWFVSQLTQAAAVAGAASVPTGTSGSLSIGSDGSVGLSILNL
jgi:hypothetical protein